MQDKTELEGMSEGPSPSYDGSMPTEAQQHWRLKVGKDGRILIPAAARALMDLGEDGHVTAHVQDGELRIISPNAVLSKIQEILKPYRSENGSIVDEFIAEKRAEAAREDAEY